MLKTFWNILAFRAMFSIFDNDSGKVISSEGLEYLEQNSKDYNVYIESFNQSIEDENR